jgi:hypothetical protein
MVVTLGHVGTPLVGGSMVLLVLGGAGLLAFFPLGPRTADQWLAVLAVWAVRGLAGHRRWTSSAHLTGHQLELGGRPPAVQALLLPQDLPPGLGDVEILEVSVDGGMTQLGIVRDGKSYIGMLAAQGPSFALMDPSEQDRIVGEWAAILAAYGIPGSAIDRVQWIERTIPEDPAALLRYARAKIPELAAAATDDEVAAVLAGMDPVRRRIVQSYLDGVTRGGPVTQQHETYVMLRLSAANPRLARQLKRAGQGSLERGACEALLRQLGSLAERLEATDIKVLGILPPRLIAETIRVAYDLSARQRARQLEQSGGLEGLDPLRCAPMALVEAPGQLQTDGSLHVTYHVAEWPRREVGATFLAPLLLQTRCTRTVSMTMEPVDTLRAHREIDRAHIGRKTAGRVLDHYGFDPTFRRQAEDAKVEDVGHELAQGHVSVRYSAYVTVSAQTQDELEAACGEVELQASASLLELERLWGQQLPAFTYTLPLGRGL